MADAKITALTENTTPALTDLMVIVDDPAGTPLTQKITLTNLKTVLGGISWSEVTGTTQSAAVDTGYICNNASLVTVTLPDAAAIGKVVAIVGKGAGGWKLAQNASENIRFGSVVTTTGTGGYIASSAQYDCVELVCTVADTTWTVRSVIGNITYV